MTNAIYLVSLLVTNLVPTGNSKLDTGTNYLQYHAVVTKQILIEEVSLCTNRTLYKLGDSKTNGSTWKINSPMLPPPLPTLPRRQ